MNQEMPHSPGEPSLRDCLAYVVAEDYQSWLGIPSPRCLEVFLAGAAIRAQFARRAIPVWRVYGPLNLPEFYLPLVRRTGHPTLTIKWPTALEIHHFSLMEAMRELLDLMRSWVQINGLETKDEIQTGLAEHEGGIEQLLESLARRPGMYLGQQSGWALRCFLAGIDRGGDWLGLPPLPGLRAIIDEIEEQSLESYGSRFAAYRVYEQAPSELLRWAGINPG